MNKIEVAEFPELKQKFYKYVTKFPTINAVISNVQNGYVYSDAKRNNIFVCAKHGWSILVAEDTAEFGFLFEFLKSNRDIPDYIHLYSPNIALINYIESTWPKFKIRYRGQFRYTKKLPTLNYASLLPLGFSIIKVQNIDFSKLDIFKFDLDNRYWHSKEDFQKNAIGVCILNSKDEPAAICYSLCVVDNVAEMDGLVLNEYRGMGLGTIALGSSLNIANENGLITHGDIFLENTPSIKMALRVGLRKLDEYVFVSTFLRDW